MCPTLDAVFMESVSVYISNSFRRLLPWNDFTIPGISSVCLTHVTMYRPALLLNMIRLNEKVHWKTVDMILTSSLLEMHTDNSTNCTLLGPVDCDSFYKWIPLSRWPGCHLIRGIAFYLLCLFSPSFLYVHHHIHCLFTSLQMTEPLVKCDCDGRFMSLENWQRAFSEWSLKKEREK